MFPNTRQVKISEQTYKTYQLTMWYFRAFGLFPFSVRKIGANIVLKFSICYLAYGWVTTGFWIFMSYYGIALDSRSKDDSIRVASDTDGLLLLIATTGYSAVSFAATFITPCLHKSLFGYIKNINQADSTMKTRYRKSDFWKLLLVMAFTFVSDFGMALFYLVGCYRIFGGTMGFFGVMERYLASNVMAAICYTSEFTNLIVLGSLEKRLKRLNELLECLYVKMDKPKNYVKRLSNGGKISTSKASSRDDENLTKLTEAFLNIMDASNELGALLGPFTLITILAVFWSLVEDPYFFLLALAGKRGTVRSAVELLETSFDIFFHITRVLLIIEPPYACLVEFQKTKGIVSKLSSCSLAPPVRRQVHTLGVMLELRRLQFSPLGFFTINRMLFTSLLDTIVTLLVVLLQYRDEIEIHW